jgi:ketosteroid isomerase-like protein
VFGLEDRQQITKFVQDFAAAYNTKDAAKMLTFYSGSALLMPPNASTVRGQESIQGYYHNRFNVDGATDLALEAKEISGEGPLAYVSGTFSLRLQPPDGTERRDRGKLLFILRNLAKSWRIEVSMWSSDLPPAVPEKPAETTAKK